MSSLLHTINFDDLNKWYVEFYLNRMDVSSPFPMVTLSSIISPVNRKIKKAAYDGSLPIVSKITFKSGSIVFRDERKTGMDLLLVKKGDLLVSNINFHQGAVALNDSEDFVCSTHYQTYIIDERKIIPYYLLLVLRSSKFLNMVAGIKANGIKNELNFDFIGSFDIPLPSLEEQKIILFQYFEVIGKADSKIAQKKMAQSEVLSDIQSKISNFKVDDGLSKKSEKVIQNIPFSSLSRWEVNYIRNEGRLKEIFNSFKYKSYTIGELKLNSLFGLSNKASRMQTENMIPMLRMSNIVNGELNLSDLKYLPRKYVEANDDAQRWLLRPGDLLINRTNSKELVGKAAVFNIDEEYTYASYLIRYRFDPKKVLSEYINIMFMLPIVKEQIDTVSRQTAGQCNINSDEIDSIRIPIPSTIAEEQEIIDGFNAVKKNGEKLCLEGKKLRESAILDFERTIFC